MLGPGRPGLESWSCPLPVTCQVPSLVSPAQGPGQGRCWINTAENVDQ